MPQISERVPFFFLALFFRNRHKDVCLFFSGAFSLRQKRDFLSYSGNTVVKAQRRKYRADQTWTKSFEQATYRCPHTCDLLKVPPTTPGCMRDIIILSPWPNIHFDKYLMFYKLGIKFCKKGKPSEISAPSLIRLTMVNLDSSQ